MTLDRVLLETQLLTPLRGDTQVVTIRSISITPPLPFIVRDYLPNASVEAPLAAGPVLVVEAVHWTRNALAGIAHAPALGVLHRDVKPGNFLIDDEGRAVLSDFGIAEDTIRRAAREPGSLWAACCAGAAPGQPASVQTDVFVV